VRFCDKSDEATCTGGYFRSIPIKIDTRDEMKTWKAALWLGLYENHCTAIPITTFVTGDKFNKH
jgi:hypothetical protein